MKRLAAVTGCVALMLAGCQTNPPSTGAPDATQSPASGPAQSLDQARLAAVQKPPGAAYKPEEIEALVAPIALYPDTLLSQVLMASTYPMEIVLAARWLKAHPDLKGDAAIQGAQKESWDASVKSLLAFPQVLEPMNDKIDWTQNLGDAFLAQQNDVFDAVQRLRAKARQTGNLASNAQQTVTTQTTANGQSVVIIEPANPQTIYVPAYDPGVVYGPWAYPAYPYYYWPPYPAYYPGYGSGIAFGVGLITAAAIFGNCDWNNNNVHIEHHKARNIDRNFDSSKLNGDRWQHNARHRQGVAYRDNASREKFGRGSPGAEARNGFRGRDGASGRDSGFNGVGNGRGEMQRDLNRGNSSLGSGSHRGNAAGSSGGFRGGGGGGRGFGGGGRGGRR